MRSIFGCFPWCFRTFSCWRCWGENVAGAVEYDEERVRECLAKAGFGPRLARMEKGLQTSLYRILAADGVEISGGEAQKIALARRCIKTLRW